MFVPDCLSRAGSRRLLTAAILCCGIFTGVPGARAQTDYAEIAQRVATMLEEEHYLRHPFDDEMSERLLDNYLEFLDFGRIYFIQEDIDRFNKDYRHQLDDLIRQRNIDAANEIYGVYLERVRSRVDLVKKLLAEGEFTFDSDRTILLSRKDAAWPKDMAASDQLWHDLLEGDLLQETLRQDAIQRREAEKGEPEPKKIRPLDAPKEEAPEAKPDAPKEEKASEAEADAADAPKKDPPAVADAKKEPEAPKDVILKRYNRILESVNDNDAEDVAVMFLKALSRAYDPHSEYFSQSQYDNFRIQMNKSLEGIGAMLGTEEDGSSSIQGLVVGGPAHKGGELQVADKIVGVGQGEEGEVEDTIGMKLSDVVDRIRGEKGTTVRLKVIPASSADGSETKIIRIIREKVDLKDSLASAELIETKDAQGNPLRLGWINLMSFYSDMDGGNTSTTADVQRLVNRLMGEGVQGIVVDLRDNGGGSLEEAINMTGLFIPRGPVVQSKDWEDRIDYKSSHNRIALWGGPLIVLTNRSSASASEIFAAALQDYNRAVIVGEKTTFGKGTVQQLRAVQTSRLRLPFAAPSEMNGALKLTIQTFFRIDGTSTQLHGVIPGVQLPSTDDVLDIGESALSNPLNVEPIPAQPYELFSEVKLPSEELAKRSSARIKDNQDFKYVVEDIADAKRRIDENTVSINRAKREQELKDLEARREVRKQETIERFAKTRESEKGLFTVYALTQDNVHAPGLTLKSDLSLEETSGMIGKKPEEEDPEIKALEYPHTFDPFKRETIHILEDLIAIQAAPQKPVDISGGPAAPPQAGR